MGLPDYQEGLRDDVLRLDHLPPLSVTASRLLSVSADPDLDIDALAAIIEQDPPLTARILGLANSAFFGQVRPILTVADAIIRVLGLNMVRSLSLSMALAGSFNTRACRTFDLSRYWLSSLITAHLAAAVGRRLRGDPRRPADALYLSGLMHNLGALVLVHLRPRDMTQVLETALEHPEANVTEIERSVLGVDRWEAGGWLAVRWHLPEVVAHTLGNLTNTSYQGPHTAVIGVIRAASDWTREFAWGVAAEFVVPGVPDEVAAAAVGEVESRLEDLRAMAASLA